MSVVAYKCSVCGGEVLADMMTSFPPQIKYTCKKCGRVKVVSNYNVVKTVDMREEPKDKYSLKEKILNSGGAFWNKEKEEFNQEYNLLYGMLKKKYLKQQVRINNDVFESFCRRLYYAIIPFKNDFVEGYLGLFYNNKTGEMFKEVCFVRDIDREMSKEEKYKRAKYILFDKFAKTLSEEERFKEIPAYNIGIEEVDVTVRKVFDEWCKLIDTPDFCKTMSITTPDDLITFYKEK